VADNAIAFELVSPQSLLVAEDVEMVVVPGAEGDFGVLPGHSPLISTVRPGVIHIFAGGSVKTRIFVAGGFAEVTPERCTVLAEEAMPVDDIDRAAAAKDLADSNDDIRDAGNDADRDIAARRVAVAQAKIAALDSPQYQ
jgi:F-type H+-transporting ATPase subunit epsilon